jgi:predicted DNA-binding protein
MSKPQRQSLGGSAWGSSAPAASEPAAMLPPPPSAAKRARAWETEQRKKVGVVTYRGVPAELQQRINELAQRNYVPAGEVARLLLEHALEALEAGKIAVNPVLEKGRLTLFPENDEY